MVETRGKIFFNLPNTTHTTMWL